VDKYLTKISYTPVPTDIFQVCHKKGSVDTKMAQTHHHDYFEVFYFLGDEMSYFIESKTFELKQFDLVFIDKYTYHKTKYTNNSSRERIITIFDESMLNIIDNPDIQQKIKQLFIYKKISFPQELNKFLLDSFKNRLLPTYATADSLISQMKAKLILLEILLSIIEWVDKGIVSVEETALTTTKEKRISNVMSHINNNFASDITLDLLASEFFIDKYYLCHTFKDVTGISVMDYINKKRLIEAERLIKYSDMSITEISSCIGFNNVSYFISLFNKKHGCTPNFMKKMYRT
jgi:YesN/AraC family two-component response regulator